MFASNSLNIEYFFDRFFLLQRYGRGLEENQSRNILLIDYRVENLTLIERSHAISASINFYNVPQLFDAGNNSTTLIAFAATWDGSAYAVPAGG